MARFIFHGDNQKAINLAQNTITHSCSKHVDIRDHFVRDLVARKVFQLRYIPTFQNIADILTKTLSSHKINHFRCDLFSQSVQHQWGEW